MWQARENEQRLEAQLDRWLYQFQSNCLLVQKYFLARTKVRILTQLSLSEMFAAESKQASTLATLAEKARALEAADAKVSVCVCVCVRHLRQKLEAAEASEKHTKRSVCVCVCVCVCARACV